MKPLQFSQKKLESDWQWMFANISTTKLQHELEAIRSCSPVTHKSLATPSVKKRAASLLYEYYAYIFWQDDFRPMRNLEWLFPTAEPIYISHDTNYILFPVQLPTYKERTCRWLKAQSYPFLAVWTTTNEFIHEADFAVDNISKSSNQRKPQEQQIKKYPHLNPLVKYDLTHSPLDVSAHLWTYKYIDISPLDRNELYRKWKIKISQGYSLKDIPRETLTHNTIERKLTLLEITPPSEIPNVKIKKASTIRLKDYSNRLFLNYFDNMRYNFYRLKDRQQAIVNYFIETSYCCQYSIPEIRAAIRQAENFVKFNSL